MIAQTRLVEVRQQVMKQNDVVARALRQRFHEAGVFVVSLVSSPGSGKTAFLARTLTELRLKYPTIFNTADIAVITKCDLAQAVEFDGAAAHAGVQSVRPGMQILELSSKTGAGMDVWLALLEQRRSQRQA